MNIAEQNGFCGGMCYSFESPKVFDKLLLADNDPLRQAIVIANFFFQRIQSFAMQSQS